MAASMGVGRPRHLPSGPSIDSGAIDQWPSETLIQHSDRAPRPLVASFIPANGIVEDSGGICSVGRGSR